MSSCKILEFSVEDLLALPRLQQGKLPKNYERSCVKSLVGEIKDILNYKADAKEIQIELKYLNFPPLSSDGIEQNFDFDFNVIVDPMRF